MIIKKFKEQVRLRPDKIAVKAGENSQTYAYQDSISDRLAHRLRQTAGEDGGARTVALLMGHNEKMITGILAVLKSGNIYIPFDPAYPEERQVYMLRDSKAAKIVTTTEHRRQAERLARQQDHPVEIINTDELNDNPEDLKEHLQAPNDVAYILYTSGSTGKPKGVVQTRSNILYYVDNWIRRFSITAEDRQAQFASFSHDGAVPDIYSALLTGATLYPFDVKRRANLEAPGGWLAREAITVWHSVPTWYRYFMNTDNGGEALTSLRLVILGGEAVREHDLIMFKKRFPRAIFANIYGQTESTVSTIKQYVKQYAPGDTGSKIVLGEPADQTEILVIDAEGNEVDELEVGEIVLQGNYLSPGYLNNPEATHSVYSQDEEEGRYYWTGDQGRQLPGGAVEILGRTDHQVKIRGFRIEPGEIETILLQHPDITEAVVTAREAGEGSTYGAVSGDSRLWAYFKSDQEFTVTQLREYLSGKLPDYMIPAKYVKMDTMPLTPTGKIDRKLLDAHGVPLDSGTQYAPPTNDIENRLTEIWKTVLKKDTIGIDDNFFDQGGNSMDVISLNDEMQKIFKRTIPAVAVYRYHTIRSLAEYLSQQQQQDQRQDRQQQQQQKITAQPTTSVRKQDRAEIAVIGMAGRFPGAGNIDAFWENLKNGKESITFYRDEELQEAGIDQSRLSDPAYVKAQSTIEDIEVFDAAFFDYTPAEAGIMDPQMRIFHQCVYHALEDAGYNPYDNRQLIGLYAGASVNFYWQTLAAMSVEQDAAGQFQARQLFDKEYMCSRVAHKLNLKGPVVSLQTACSTTLVAIHMAARDLSAGECDIALAGGVSVPQMRKEGYRYREGMILSSDGHNRTFDARADGTVFGNGVGVVVLKRLEDARADGDHIYAVVKGTAVNNDGRDRAGFTAPSEEGEAAVIRAAMQVAGVEPETVGYVEAHGTATALGDPIEIEGLKQAYNTDKKGYCAVGSVKSNVGHLNIASGVTGFIKTVLALKHRQIPPSLHYETPNPAIDFKNSPFYVNTKLSPWQNDVYPRRAGVSSFGIGGTNAHVVLEEAPPVDHTSNEAPIPTRRVLKSFCGGSRGAVFSEKSPPGRRRQPQLLVLSAKTAPALDRMTANLARHIEADPDIDLADAAYTLKVGRNTYNHRRFLVANDTKEALRKLASPNYKQAPKRETKTARRPVIYMFSGMGSQYVDMGRGLYRDEPEFRAAMDRSFEQIERLTGHDIKSLLYPQSTSQPQDAGKTEPLARPEIGQLALFAFEYSLVQLLKKWGITPYAMIGYSFGEYTAATISGVLTPEAAITLIDARGRLIERIDPGIMLSVPMAKERMVPILSAHPQLSLAIDNGPSTIIAGPEAAVETLEEELKKQRRISMRLQGTRALHTPMMTPIVKEYEKLIADEITLGTPKIPYISNVTGTWANPEKLRRPGYWARHLSGAVRYAEGIKELMKIDGAIFLEVGPGRGLTTLQVRHIEGSELHETTNLVRSPEQNQSDVALLQNRIGRLWQRGVEIDWHKEADGQTVKRIPMPPYPFERNHISSRKIQEQAARLFSQAFPQNEPEPQTAHPEEASQPPEAGSPRPELETEYVEPVTEEEQKIVAAWEDYFGIEPVGIDDDFFELGGDSLKALIVIDRMNKALDKEITMEQLFRTPTVRGLAETISAEPAVKEKKTTGNTGLAAMIEQPHIQMNRTVGPGRRLFCFPPALGFGVAYKALAEISDGDVTVNAFNYIEAEDRREQYVRYINRQQPAGPLVLLGYSAAGKLTLQVARALEDLGREVSDIILLDSFWPREDMADDVPEAAQQTIGSVLDKSGVGNIKEIILKKIKKYRTYFIEPVRLEKVNADLHLILSEEYKDTPQSGCWKEITTQNAPIYRGAGTHMDMLQPGSLEKNWDIIRDILDNVTPGETQESAHESTHESTRESTRELTHELKNQLIPELSDTIINDQINQTNQSQDKQEASQ